MRNSSYIDRLIQQAMASEQEQAAEAGALGFMARAMVQATMPHRSVDTNEFERVNGHYRLNMLAPSSIGLPYGTIPRLLMAWLTTETLRTKEPELVLGNSLSEFMAELELVPTGGRWGSITRLKNQTQRLFNATVSCTYEDADKTAAIGYRIASRTMLWWDADKPKDAAQRQLWQSTVTLSQDFFDEVVSSPVPIDMRALKALKKSPMALDIYCWLTYRMSYLSRETLIPWPALATQFGAEYGRIRDFKAAFIQQLRKVHVMYPEARIEEAKDGLKLKPSRTHVPHKRSG